jgi:hypothetical protein
MKNNQNKILENFMAEFLPPTGNQQKYSGNELDYITRTFAKVFIQNFGFKLTKEEVAYCFFKLGYQIFDKNGCFDSTTKKVKTSNADEGYFFILNCYTYFNISPKTMRQLMLTTSKLSEITNSEKINNTEKMKFKLEKFKNKIIYNNVVLNNDILK